MKTTVKRFSVALSKEDIRVLEALMARYGETQSQVIKRAIRFTESEAK